MRHDTPPPWSFLIGISRCIFVSVSVILAVIIIFLIYSGTPSPAMEEALGYLQSSVAVDVKESDKWFSFLPTSAANSTCNNARFIFFPGGHVDARAYAPPLHRLAASGCETFLIKPPLNFAILDVDIAAEVIKQYPLGTRSLIGGV